MSTPLIEDEAEALKFVSDITDQVGVDRLKTMVAALILENNRQNLISNTSIQEIWRRHVADSAQLLRFVPRETRLSPGVWLDLGTGAGFPGLVLSILQPKREFVLVESRAQRIRWLRHIIDELGLSHCSVEGCRLEQLTPFPASVISARAFAPLKKLLKLSSPFSTNTTVHLLPKGRSAAQELDGIPKEIRRLFHVEQSLTDRDAGILVADGLEKGGIKDDHSGNSQPKGRSW